MGTFLIGHILSLNWEELITKFTIMGYEILQITIMHKVPYPLVPFQCL